MSFAAFSNDPIAGLIREASTSPRLTLLVGAGASMEAGLPSWEGLVNRLILRAARETGLVDLGDEQQRDRWVAEAARDGFLGAAAIVDALAGQDRDRWIAEELFGPPAGPADFFPGPISRQVPNLRRAFGEGLRTMTLNYDDLIEQAVREDAETEPVAVATGDYRVGADAMPIYHLHGYLGRDGRDQGQLVLSEADYQRMQQGPAWQEELMATALRDSTLIFVGTSLLDPNMLRYLHRVRGAPPGSRFAVFVRQGTYEKDVPAGIPAAREKALAARWQAVGVEAVFVDHYVDVAQLLHEIARAKRLGDAYVGLPERARDWVTAVERELLGFHDDEAFVRGQQTIGAQLRSALNAATKAAEELEGRTWDEKLALSMWLVDSEGRYVTNWVTTDRMHLDRGTVEPVEIDEHARWLAVRSYCRGTPLAESRDIYASRWRFIRGTPLVVDSEDHGRIPVGCLTTASMERRDTTMLNEMEDIVEARFNQALSTNVLALLGQPFAAQA